MKLDLSKKIALFAGVLIVAVASILGAVTLNVATKALITQQKALALQAARASAGQVQATVNMRLGVLNEVANRASTQTMDWEVQREYLKPDVKRMGYLDLAVVFPDGTARYVISDDVINMGDRDYVQKAMQGEGSLSGVILSQETDEPVIIYAVPIPSGTSVQGVLVGIRDGGALSDITDEVTEGGNGYAFILGPESTFFAHPDRSLVAEQSSAFQEIETEGSLKEFALKLKELGLGKEGSIEYVYDGEYRMITLVPIPGTDWTLAIGSYEKDVKAGAYELRSIVILISFIIAAVGILGAVILGRVISRPVVILRRIAEKLAIGDVEVEAVVKTNDEIGDLSIAIEKIVESSKEQAEAAKKIIEGDLSLEITPRSEKDIVVFSMSAMTQTLRELRREANMLTAAAVEGRLEVRGDTEKFKGGFREIIAGVNDTLDAVIKPLNVAAEYVERISKGDIPAPITDEYKGDFNEIKNNLNGCIDVMNGLLSETNMLIQSIQNGNLNQRGNAGGFDGDWGTLVKGVNHLIDAFVSPINVTAEYVERISKGDIPEKITDEYKGDFNEIKNNLNSCVDVMNGLLRETNMLIQAIRDGKLGMRGNAGGFDGDWGTLVEDVNHLIDAFVLPINVTAEYVERISKGDIPEKITDEYKGDFNEIKSNLNNCIDIMNGLLNETNELIKAAQEGQLDARANTAVFAGGWEALVGGINELVEAVVRPIKEVTAVMNDISEGNLDVSVDGDFLGEFGVLAEAVNNTARNLNRVIGEISKVLGEVSGGNLAINNVESFKGDFVGISNSLNLILDSLNLVISDISSSSEQVSVGSKQVSDGSQTLSQGTTEQASSIEELNASITEVASLTKENASSANEATQLTLTVKESAALGNQHMTDMLQAMEEINESSNNISKIIKVIDDIAFQTNILALNAAVEAARAGQHGKGFAVVAEEVRSLAARSAEAAKNTTELIEGSINKSNAGTNIANNTAKALAEIVSGVTKVTEVITDIAKSSNEQAMGITQINQGLNQVSQVVQSNAATAEESAASSEELSGQAELLKEMVARFKIRETGRISTEEIKHLNYSVKADMKTIPAILLDEGGYDKY